jgi:hypothetical protein
MLKMGWAWFVDFLQFEGALVFGIVGLLFITGIVSF